MRLDWHFIEELHPPTDSFKIHDEVSVARSECKSSKVAISATESKQGLVSLAIINGDVGNDFIQELVG